VAGLVSCVASVGNIRALLVLPMRYSTCILALSRTDSDDGFFYLFLQKPKLASGHVPFGYSPPRNKEAHVMMRPP
jgi:hypothetical protein